VVTFTVPALYGPEVALDSNGTPQPSAVVTIYPILEDGSVSTTPATLFSDRLGTSLSNPLPSGVAPGVCGIDVFGNVMFRVLPGDYSLQAQISDVRHDLKIVVDPDPEDALLGMVAATSSNQGVIKLAGDLGGTAASPTVPNAVKKGDLVLNVKDFGAVGDSVTDDTFAINTALAAFVSTGGVLYFPSGTYIITGNINVPQYVGLEGNSGSGQASRIHFTGTGTAISLNQYSRLEDIKITSNNQAGAVAVANVSGQTHWSLLRVEIDTVQTGVLLTNTWVVDILGCFIKTCGNGIITSATINTQVNAVRIRGGEIYGCGIGVNLQGAVNSFLIEGTTIEGNSTAGVFSDVRASGHLVNSLTIRDTYFETNGTYDCNIAAIQGLIFTGNYFFGSPTCVNVAAKSGFIQSNMFNPANTFGSKSLVVSSSYAQDLVIGTNFYNYAPATFNPSDDAGTNTRYSYVPDFASQSVTSSGAVTVDATAGRTQEITLSADALSTTITNPHANRLTICWVQNSTGANTYVWPANCKFAGGSAPSDTTANTRTSVTFTYNGTNWIEVSRAVAVH
jgi:Pectate lyase superfamily protein